MKKISIILFSLLLLNSCGKNHPKEYLTLSGTFENNKDSIVSIANQQGVIKEIVINADGSFKDTLKVETGAIYTIASDSKRSPIYLKNGYKPIGEMKDFPKGKRRIYFSKKLTE